MVDTTIIAECAGCGYMSSDIEDFVTLASGGLCHGCYDDTVGYSHTVYLYEEEVRQARALADSINVDYLD